MMKTSFLRQVLTVGTAAVLTTASQALLPPTAKAQGGTPGLMEFRWDSDRNYRKLYSSRPHPSRTIVPSGTCI